MGKNIKDIVDEGFTRLANLAEKRLEIVSNCAKIAEAAGGTHFEAAGKKVRAAESSYLTEINTLEERLLAELRQAVAQVAESNQFFQGGTREALATHLSGCLDEMNHGKEYMLQGSSERLDSLFLQTQKEFKSHEDFLRSESARLFQELKSLCRGSHSDLHQAHAEMAGKLTQTQDEFVALLGEACDSIIRDAEAKRCRLKEDLEKTGREHASEMSRRIEDLDELVTTLVAKSLQDLKATCINIETELNEKRSIFLAETVSSMQAVSKDSLVQLEDSYDYSQKELTEKLTLILELTKNLLQHEQQSLAEQDAVLRGNIVAIGNELKNGGADAGAGPRSPVEEAFSEIAGEMNTLGEELNHKMRALLAAQAEAMAKLCAASEKSFLDLFADFMTQMKENMKVQDQLFDQKEEELLKQLERLEKQISATRAVLHGAGDSGARGGT
jgi:hypothetical protein